MPNDWWTWLGAIASIIGIISFVAWIRERIQRQRQSDLLMGFLAALRAQANAMGQAGEEWRYNVGKNLASPADAAQYANVAVNNWLKLKEEIDKLLQQLEHL
jgi:type II secretory pathway pseudopilin PulG